MIFILKSWEDQTHYEITYDKNSGFNIKDSFDNYNINEDSSIKIFINYGKYDYGRHLDDIQLDQLGPKELYTVLKQMQHEKKLPAIIFKFDPTKCKKVANDLLEWMETEEQIKYPHYRERTLK